MSKKVTINDVAKLANTSKTTVSFYLNGKYDKMSETTRVRIQQAIQETDYKPSIIARGLTSKQTKLIGVLIGDITNSFSNQILKGIEEAANDKGYQVIIGNSDYSQTSEDRYIESMLQLGVDGFVIQPTSNFRKYSRIINEKNKKIVFFDSQLYEYNSNWVKTNNYDAVYDTIQSCVKKGYEKFILITADPSRLSTRIERTSGFIDALTDVHRSYSELIISDVQTDVSELETFLKQEIDAEKPTLIFAPNCWALPLVYTTMKNLGCDMPRVGLLGFDNTEWSNLASPTVSTIVQPAFEEGSKATHILIDDIQGLNEEEKHQVLNCYVNWNESTNL